MKKSVIEEVLLFKSVKFSMSEAVAILLKETGCLKHSRITLSNENSVETPAISSMRSSENHTQKSDIIRKGYLLSAYFLPVVIQEHALNNQQIRY